MKAEIGSITEDVISRAKLDDNGREDRHSSPRRKGIQGSDNLIP